MTNFSKHVSAIAARAAVASAIALAMTCPASAAANATDGPSLPRSATEAPVNLAQADTVASVPDARVAKGSTAAYPSIETGVRKAASQGPEALRRYISRTRMIYGFYFPDFAKPQ